MGSDIQVQNGTLLQRFSSAALMNFDRFAAIIVPVLAAIALFGLASSGSFQIADGLLFDMVTRSESGQKPAVVIIEQDADFVRRDGQAYQDLITAASEAGISRIGFASDPGNQAISMATELPVVISRKARKRPASSAWEFVTSSDEKADNVTFGAALVTSPEYGIFRRHWRGIGGAEGRLPLFESALADIDPDGAPTYVRMPRSQNIPRISASQLLAKNFQGRELAGLTALVVPPRDHAERRLATSMNPSTGEMRASVFSAYVTQAYLDGRSVRPAGMLLTFLSLLAACALARGAQDIFAEKRLILPVAAAVAIGVLGASWVALQYANVLLPASAMLAGVGIVTIWYLLRREKLQDRRLGEILEQAINLSFRRSAIQDHGRLIEFFGSTAKILGIPKMVLFTHYRNQAPEILSVQSASQAKLALTGRHSTQLLRRADRSSSPVPASSLAPQWTQDTYLASLGTSSAPLYWLFELPSGASSVGIGRIASAMASSIKDIQRWRSDLSSGSGVRKQAKYLDDRVASAANLITIQGEQIRNGLDSLNTAVMIFHMIGYPIQSNTRMSNLYGEAEISLADSNLTDVIAAFTQLEIEQIERIISDILLNGGEMRIPMREIGTRQRILRVAAPTRQDRAWERVIVIEAIDISDLDQLAELRLAVGMFIDKQLRNDLEAIGLGANIAADPRLKPTALAKVIGRIRDVATRATDRLETVAQLLSDSPVDTPGPCYPIDALKAVTKAIDRARPLANEMQVQIDADLPGISGFTMAEPLMLSDMVEAMLRLVILDTTLGGTVKILLDEQPDQSWIRIQGGFGIPFERLCESFDASAKDVPSEYQIIAAGILEALAWRGGVSYWSAVGTGYRFNIQLRRIG
ncbi:nitrogen regulation protein NR(II) [Pontixanthobacter gangjinensis]|uniref:CHASE2 domain-containing protein n=1 Tax=Pontixanthobacter gangjinensis TaxID=1028742 RepID=A0A6I4SJC2_9SPHN|nr:hypothetical protein [Pontixanthobacter gangjinensis]MXO55694.1 hypothetical protein [Pontixanthobacter gangjinensis]